VEIANLVVVAALCGLTWTIGVVHYPLFSLVGEDAWMSYGEAHRRRVTWVVLPLMSANVALGGVLAAHDWTGLTAANLALPAAIFVTTGIVFAPIHGRLTLDGVPRLVRLHWARTAAWTAQLAVAVAIAA
jgi:hypothetical protein